MAHRETTIDPGDGGAALVAGLLLLVLIVVVVGLLFLTLRHDASTVIDLDAPRLTTTLTPIGK